MKILGDSQIRLFNELFASLGQVSTYSGRNISSSQLVDVDALITRSTVNVDRALLENTSVTFVGTCTIGTDHLDLDYLHRESIAWANAPACNANAVVQYVLSAMAQLAPEWMQSTVGIVGCGNVGGRVYHRLSALGVDCRVYDPFLSSQDNSHLTTLEHVLQADIVTCHAPLTMTGEYPTYHMIDQRALEQLRPHAVLINAGRGAVIDNQALIECLSNRKDIRVALDVWENEPNICPELMALVDIATPHIAGHSLEGKEQGTVMVYKALCNHLNIAPPLDASTMVNSDASDLPVPVAAEAGAGAESIYSYFNALLLAAYPIMDDDARLRAWLTNKSPADAEHTVSLAQHFDTLRKTYPVRREYSHFRFPSTEQYPPIKHWLTILSA